MRVPDINRRASRHKISLQVEFCRLCGVDNVEEIICEISILSEPVLGE